MTPDGEGTAEAEMAQLLVGVLCLAPTPGPCRGQKGLEAGSSLPLQGGGHAPSAGPWKRQRVQGLSCKGTPQARLRLGKGVVDEV